MLSLSPKGTNQDEDDGMLGSEDMRGFVSMRGCDFDWARPLGHTVEQHLSTLSHPPASKSVGTKEGVGQRGVGD